MLTDTQELEVAWRALSGQAHDRGQVTVALGEAGGRFRAGIVYPGGEETLLVGFRLEALPRRADLPEGSGFRVDAPAESFSPDWPRWLCLMRQEGAGRDLFAQMAADVMSSVALGGERSEVSLLALMLSRIRAWQAFMKRPFSGVLSPDEEVGLAGELMVLRQLVNHGGAPGSVVQAWVGPARGLQDFQTETLGLEVKSTVSAVGFPARISSLEQLDPEAGRPVLLAALRLAVDDAGETLPDLAASARRLFASEPRAAALFERSLLLAGYSDETASAYSRRFVCRDERVFEVDHLFPRLIRSEVRPEILEATYDIDIDLVSADPETLEGALVRFGGF